MASLATILASVAKLIGASDKFDAIVNGPATGTGSTVTVTSGVLPTFAKAIADFEASGGSGPFPTVNLGSFGGATLSYTVPGENSGAQFLIYENATITLPNAALGANLTFTFYVMTGTKVPTFAGASCDITLPDGFSAFPSTAGKGYMVRARYCQGTFAPYWMLEVSPAFTPPVQDP